MAMTRSGLRAGAGAGAGADPTDEELVCLFMAVLRPLKQHFSECAAALDLSQQQALALRELDEPTSMRELAGRLLCDASNVTGLVDRLEARGLVERRVDAEDRRVKWLVLTASGRQLRARHHQQVFADVPLLSSLAPGDRRLFAELLTRLVRAGDGPEHQERHSPA